VSVSVQTGTAVSDGAAETALARKAAIGRRDGPTLIEVPVGVMPSPWEFILMGRVRGRKS